jgi:uncharacterized protein YndB with AHSA1/START domain
MKPIKELEIERIYEAPVSEVWKAWTEPEQIKAWWGPDNVTIPECEVDLRVGGRIYIVMEAGEAMGPYKGTKWPMDGVFTIVEENSRLTYSVKAWTEGQEATTEIDQVTELRLHEENGKTVLTLKATINKTGTDAKMAAEGMQMGFSQQLEKLNKYLLN